MYCLFVEKIPFLLNGAWAGTQARCMGNFCTWIFREPLVVHYLCSVPFMMGGSMGLLGYDFFTKRMIWGVQFF